MAPQTQRDGRQQLRMALTPEQCAQIKALFGADVTEFTVLVEEAPTPGETPVKMKVLKVDSIAYLSDFHGWAPSN